MTEFSTVWLALVDWLANGLWAEATWWQVLLVTLAMTHITICAVTIFLHRAQAHRALDLHPIPSHFFRFWLWLTTGMVTKEFVAMHRKHHAKCETVEDPHSPQTRGIKTVLLTGRSCTAPKPRCRDAHKYGKGTPDDWIERNLYTRFQLAGRGPDADPGTWPVRRHRPDGVGGADAVDPGDRHRHHQRHRPLLGLPQLRGGRCVDQRLALGHPDRRRRAAQQPPHLPDLGQVLGQALRVRHRLALHPRHGEGGPGQGAQDRRRNCWRWARSSRGRRQDAGGDHRQPLRGDGQVRQGTARRLRCRAGAVKQQGAAHAWPTCNWPSAGCTATPTRSPARCCRRWPMR
jgi:hypothetical protein